MLKLETGKIVLTSKDIFGQSPVSGYEDVGFALTEVGSRLEGIAFAKHYLSTVKPGDGSSPEMMRDLHEEIKVKFMEVGGLLNIDMTPEAERDLLEQHRSIVKERVNRAGIIFQRK